MIATVPNGTTWSNGRVKSLLITSIFIMPKNQALASGNSLMRASKAESLSTKLDIDYPDDVPETFMKGRKTDQS